MRSIFANFQHLFNWLSFSAPCFPVKGDQISILYKPEDFYDTLINSCSQATQRILLVSLYLGTGEKEQRLVTVIKSRALELGTSINIKIILDAIRGSRGNTNNSRKMLLPLIEKNTGAKVALFHTPNLKGFLRRIIPTRYNELIGLQHMKLYVIDDNVLISGANLSDIYFTNRQDRYVLIKNCKHLADFFDGLIHILYEMSLKLDYTDSLSFKNYQKIDLITTATYKMYHPYEKNTSYYVNELRNRILAYYLSFVSEPKNIEDCDTLIFPTIEIPPCDIHKDSYITEKIIGFIPRGSTIHMASGYFNFTDQLVDVILSSKAKFNALIAHPTANGFYQSNGFSKYIPNVYSELSNRFYQKVKSKSQSNRITLYEYQRQNYTFHGKGVWVTFPEQTLPQLTIVGSSNFGARSKNRDLESQIVIITDNKKLKNQLYEELYQMFKYGNVFRETERKTEILISWFANLFRSFF